jgi:ABC-type multidrug transport system fused ATPase/permease subunit
LSERASNLSQGQRQLVAIARAVLANPRIWCSTRHVERGHAH